ncbi:MAG TPA: TQO small subunit DoxD [Candidatus Nanopelagicaceae bacterium]|nr:TQO small subunit DoxD [Candidatus Nanopelagicaceae bacterium]
MTSIADSYRSQSWSQRILRLWLGATFIYAGWNKASDGAFFTPSSTHFIGKQLTGFAHGSPLRPFLELAAHQAIVVGWLTLLTEMALGIAILLDIASLPAAIVGALLSLTLWLSSSWHIHPYFLGSDSAYFVMWGAYATALIQKKSAPIVNSKGRAVSRQRPTPAASAADRERRQVIRVGLVAGFAVLGGILGRLLKSSPSTRTNQGSPSASSGGSTANLASGASSSSTKNSGANVLIPLSGLPVGSAAMFTAANGDPAILIRTGSAKVCAYDAVCTHAGCTVEYDPGSKTLICPCHGAQYDVLSHAAVLAGPAPAPLTEINVKIDGTNIVLA